MFVQAQLERRGRKVREYLQGIKSAEVRLQVVAQCRKDLEDLEMADVVREFGGHGDANAQFEAAVDEMGMDEQLAMQLQMEIDDDDLV